MQIQSQIGVGVALVASLLIGDEPVPERNRQPYAGIDWAKVQHVQGTTHAHVNNQERLDRVHRDGLRFLTVTNYYPSAPYWPLREVRAGQFRPQQAHGAMRNGKWIPGPIDWNALITDPEEGWLGEIPEEFRTRPLLKAGERLFPRIPAGILEAPNAEHHGFTDTGAHINSPGSAFASGTFDVKRRYLLEKKGFARGSGRPWRDVYKDMLAGLICPEGGGIVINHPISSKLKQQFVLGMLDFDPRVLGMEIFNHSCVKGRPNASCAENEALWDGILATGRQCFGFFVPDWQHCFEGVWMGRCVLLVDEFGRDACLRAYRNGAFYGALLGDKLRFTKLVVTDKGIEVALDKPARIVILTEKGIVSQDEGKGLGWEFPEPKPVFVRVRVEHESGERLYSQPTMLGPARKR
ncbi:MAG: hypothetical protein HN380_13775 [Victivallales bacterium]|nr:hypothetical protein [Victivallales bacterium]